MINKVGSIKRKCSRISAVKVCEALRIIFDELQKKNCLHSWRKQNRTKNKNWTKISDNENCQPSLSILLWIFKLKSYQYRSYRFLIKVLYQEWHEMKNKDIFLFASTWQLFLFYSTLFFLNFRIVKLCVKYLNSYKPIYSGHHLMESRIMGFIGQWEQIYPEWQVTMNQM